MRAKRWSKPGNPAASASAILKIVDPPTPPLRAFFGESPRQTAKADYESRLANWEQWQPVAVEAQGSPGGCRCRVAAHHDVRCDACIGRAEVEDEVDRLNEEVGRAVIREPGRLRGCIE